MHTAPIPFHYLILKAIKTIWYSKTPNKILSLDPVSPQIFIQIFFHPNPQINDTLTMTCKTLNLSMTTINFKSKINPWNNSTNNFTTNLPKTHTSPLLPTKTPSLNTLNSLTQTIPISTTQILIIYNRTNMYKIICYKHSKLTNFIPKLRLSDTKSSNNSWLNTSLILSNKLKQKNSTF